MHSMCNLQENVEEWQLAASSLLTVLCRRSCSTVVECLLQKFQPGLQPHCYVLHTLGDIAVSNGLIIV